MAKSAWAKLKLENAVLHEIVFQLLTIEELEALKERKRNSESLHLQGSVLNMLDQAINTQIMVQEFKKDSAS